MNWTYLGLGLAFVFALLWWWERSRGARRQRARMKRAQWGEAHAELLLKREGYELLERQQTAKWTMYVDGDPVVVSCRADLIVCRDGLIWVVEVKTGQVAPNPTKPATRRQLLEYSWVFEADGVLLVDTEQNRIYEIEFEADE